VSLVRLYPCSNGGAPRLVAVVGAGAAVGVWHAGSGAFLGALPCPKLHCPVLIFLTYQRPSDGRPRIAAGSRGGHLCIWDGDDFQLLHALVASADGCAVKCLAVYDEPTVGATRLVTG
jgi:hypothetical protein